MVVRDACPACGSTRYKHNGHTHHGTHTQQGTAGERPRVAMDTDRRLADAQRTMLAHVLRERLARRGIAVRWVSVSPGFYTLLWSALQPVLMTNMSGCHSIQPIECCDDWKLRPMSCGALCSRKPTSHGSGAPWTPPPTSS